MKTKIDLVTNSSSTSIVLISDKELNGETEIKIKLKDLCTVHKHGDIRDSWVYEQIKQIADKNNLDQIEMNNLHILEFSESSADIAHQLLSKLGNSIDILESLDT